MASVMKKLLLIILIFNFIFLFSCSDNIDNIENVENTAETEIITTTENIVQQPEKLFDLDIVYDEYNDLKLDIYYPTNIIYEKSPLIVAFHGGGWVAGDKSQIMYIFAPLIEELRENGYTIATVQYRYADETIYFPAQVEDCINAILYLKNYLGDVDSIGVMGYSAGAHLAMLSVYAMNKFSASGEMADIKYCLSFAGPAKFYDEELNDYSPQVLYLIENMFHKIYEAYRAGSPYYHIEIINEKYKIPLFLAHDENDDVVPFSQSQVMFNKAAEVGIECELLKLNGVRHQIDFNSGLMNSPSSGEAVRIILDFIYKYSGK